MKLHELKNMTPRPDRKRVGRGDGSGHGRTAGRGEKGAGARTGHTSRPFFEGGQIPLIRRLPKRGFKNPNHIEYVVVNLSTLEEKFDSGSEVIDREALRKRGLIGKTRQPLKILGYMGENEQGEKRQFTKKLCVRAEKFSKSARRQIEGQGGTCQEVGKNAGTDDAQPQA